MRFLILASILGFGWACRGASAIGGMAAQIIVPCTLVVAIGLVLIGRTAAARPDTPSPVRHGRLAWIINFVFLLVLLNLAFVCTRMSGHPELIVPAISIAGGSNLLPMAYLLKSRSVALAGLAMCGVALGVGILITVQRTASTPAIVECFLNAGILWATAILTIKLLRAGASRLELEPA